MGRNPTKMRTMVQRNRNGNLEYRTYDVTKIEVVTRDDEPAKIVGHAAVFDKIGDAGWYKEKIAPGAFAQSIVEDDIRALFNHDRNYVLGRNTKEANTLALAEDAIGLTVEIIPPDTQLIRDIVLSPIRRRDITQMSFAFEIAEENRQVGEDNEPDLYTIIRAILWDVSPVTFPFYEQTDVSLHERQAWTDENHIRQADRPNTAGKRLQLLKRTFEARRL